jgi:hypothetical protein
LRRSRCAAEPSSASAGPGVAGPATADREAPDPGAAGPEAVRSALPLLRVLGGAIPAFRPSHHAHLRIGPAQAGPRRAWWSAFLAGASLAT